MISNEEVLNEVRELAASNPDFYVGKYVLIANGEIQGIYKNLFAGIKEGNRKFGFNNFICKKVA